MSETAQFCTFVVGGNLFGVPIERVREIVREQAPTRVPLAPKAILGLMNLRGDIVPIVDLRHCLLLESATATDLTVHVVLRTSEGAVSLRADAIGDVLDLRPEEVEAVPPHLPHHITPLLRGVYQQDSCLLLVLETNAVLEAALSTSDRAQHH